MNYSKSKRITASGFIVERACAVSAITAYGGANDMVVQLRDGGASGTVKWEFEVDSATSSPPFSFPRSIYFATDLYITMSGGDGNRSVSAALDEPESSTDI